MPPIAERLNRARPDSAGECRGISAILSSAMPQPAPTSEERIRFRANPEKTLEALIYIANREALPGWRLLKVVYYADKRHLEKYGRSVTGDRYIAMENGPVPSLTRDLIEVSAFLPEPVAGEAVMALERKLNAENRNAVHARRAPKMHVFSRTDVECLDWALATIGPMPYEELNRRSHDEPAYVNAPLNAEMSVEEMIDPSVPNRDAIIADLRENAGAIVF